MPVTYNRIRAAIIAGNTSGATASISTGTLQLAGGNNITLSQNGNSVTISAGAGGGGGAAISLPANGDSRTSGGAGYSNISTGTANFFGNNLTLSQDGASITFSANAPGAAAENNWHHLLGANTAGNTTVSGSTIGFSGLNMTLSGTNASQMVLSVPATSSLSATGIVAISTNGSTISIGASLPILSFYRNMPNFQPMGTGASAITQTSGSSLFIQPFELPYNISIGYIRFLASFNDSAVGTAGTTSANTSASVQRTTTFGVVIYIQGVGASSQSIQSLVSTSQGLTGYTRYSAGANGSQYTISIGKTYPQSGGADQNYGTSYAVSSGSIVISSNSNTLFTGPRFLDIPFATSLSAGVYWLGIGASTASASNSNIISFAGTDAMMISLAGVSQSNVSVGLLGAATSASAHQMYPGLGIHTTNASAFTRDSVAISQVSQLASNRQLPFQFIRRA